MGLQCTAHDIITWLKAYSRFAFLNFWDTPFLPLLIRNSRAFDILVGTNMVSKTKRKLGESKATDPKRSRSKILSC